MKMKWAALLLTMGLSTAGAHAGGFGFSIASTTVTNFDTNGNGKADVGEKFEVNGAAFTSFRSVGGAPVINDNDLNRYSAKLTGTAVEVDGFKVRYTGTFELIYNGPVVSNEVVETGTLDLRATYRTDGSAILSGTFMATPGAQSTIAPFDTTDFAPYNTGRFFALYVRNPGGATGTLTANMNAGAVGVAASLNNGTITNNDANGNGKADVGETFTMSVKMASYYQIGAPPLNNNDLDRYTLILNGRAISVNNTVVEYAGTFTLHYSEAGVYEADVEKGGFTLTAEYAPDAAGAARLRGQFLANAGFEQTVGVFNDSDWAIFNPGVFTGTYTPIGTGATGSVSGSLIGGVLGFSASVGDATVINADTNSNGYADVGETFRSVGPLSAYFTAGAPPLLDKDLNRYTITLDGIATNVTGTTVTYVGKQSEGRGFRITYSGPAITTDIEIGDFEITAVYNARGEARLVGQLMAAPGVSTPIPPFDLTDYAAFNPATFTGYYAPSSANPAVGVMRGGLVAGTQTRVIHARKFTAGVEGSVSATTLINTGSEPALDDARRVIVPSGTTLFVVDPATGDDAEGWFNGKTLDGKVMGRPATLKDIVYVGTDTGTLYAFNLRTGALVGSAKPGGEGSKILTAPAPVNNLLTGEAVDHVLVSVSNVNGTADSAVVKVAANALGTVVASQNLGAATSVSSPAAPGGATVFVGSNTGLYALDYMTLAIKTQTAVPVPTSPFVAASKVYVGTNDGTTLSTMNSSTGAVEANYNLGSPLVLTAFYEKGSNLIEAGVLDGRILSFDTAGSFVGLTLPGLFNAEQTGGSRTSPVLSNKYLYRGTENKQIVSGLVQEGLLNGDFQETIDTSGAIRGAMTATGQMVGTDWVVGVSPNGVTHFVAVR